MRKFHLTGPIAACTLVRLKRNFIYPCVLHIGTKNTLQNEMGPIFERSMSTNTSKVSLNYITIRVAKNVQPSSEPRNGIFNLRQQYSHPAIAI